VKYHGLTSSFHRLTGYLEHVILASVALVKRRVRCRRCKRDLLSKAPIVIPFPVGDGIRLLVSVRSAVGLHDICWLAPTIFLKRQKCTPSPAGTAGGGQGGLSGLSVDRVVSLLDRECAARLPRAARPPHQAIAKWIAAANVAGSLGHRAPTGPGRFKASTYNSISQGFTPDVPRPCGSRR
jgi:hypothetical protein